MALVMLPCDLPWWDSVKKHLKQISNTKNSLELIETMQKIHDICNVSLDPDEDTTDPDTFVALLNFLDNDLTSEERSNFFNKTLPMMVRLALKLKEFKPKGGLHFSLQQQPDSTELQYSFVSSLIANAFFSTFPRRTDKTHPTLQNFNFSHFFKYLQNNVQKSKLRSILYYFDWLENNDNNGVLRISRQVMTSKEWLTIEDWLECSLQLCPLQIKHEGKLERSEKDSLQVCFADSKIGGKVLLDGNNQESINLITHPELLTVLLNVEALEDNEVLTVEKIRHISRITDPKNRAILQKLETPQETTFCCMDADDYKSLPLGQYEEDNILRELNKCLLAFQQKPYRNTKEMPSIPFHNRQRRLSPIGESMGSTQSDSPNIPLITQQSCSTNRSSSPCDINLLDRNKLRVEIEAERGIHRKGMASNEGMINNRRGRFIVLGSSGECLPVKRHPLESTKVAFSSCESSEDEFHSAKTSLDDEDKDDDNFQKRYSIDLETAERRSNFAQRLREALKRELSDSFSSEESSYAVGISVTGSNVEDRQFKVRRGGSTGFALQEDSLDEDFLQNSLTSEKKWIDNFKNKKLAHSLNKSSEYSFSTEYSSEMEEVYDQFSKWLQNPILETDKGSKKELEGRELAVVQFAGSLLKRTLSESFAGVPVPLAEEVNEQNINMDETNSKNKLVLNAKSLSLELARHKHKLAAQLIGGDMTASNVVDRKLTRRAWFMSCVKNSIVQTLEDVDFSVRLPKVDKVSQLVLKPKGGLKVVSTGNWGCGSSKCGDVQLKAIIQWMAASVAGVPTLKYYTCSHEKLTKFDTLCRLLIDRKWSVKDLAQATLRYSSQVLQGREESGNLFEELIGIERT